MRKILLFMFALIATNFTVAQATYETSGNASTWNDSNSWVQVSGSDTDADGIPDSDDNVTILHDISVSSTVACNNLTTSAPAPSFVRKVLTVDNGTITVSGDVTNNGEIIVGSANTGTMNITGDLDNNSSITVNAGSMISLTSS